MYFITSLFYFYTHLLHNFWCFFSVVFFCFSIISVANLIQTTGNTALGDDMIKMLVILRMNRNFMDYMSSCFPKAIINSFGTEHTPATPSVSIPTPNCNDHTQDEETLNTVLGLPCDLNFFDDF